MQSRQLITSGANQTLHITERHLKRQKKRQKRDRKRVLRHDQTAAARTLCWKADQMFLKKRNTCPGHWRWDSADIHLRVTST